MQSNFDGFPICIPGNQTKFDSNNSSLRATTYIKACYGCTAVYPLLITERAKNL